MYTLSEAGWRKVLPVIKAVATFGLDLIEPTESALTPLNGFLAGVLLAFEPGRASGVSSTYRVEIDGRAFEFAVHEEGLTAPSRPPAVTLTATAADLITARMGSSMAERKAALRHVKFDGDVKAVDLMRKVFQLAGDPGLS